MRATKIMVFAATALIIGACKSSKKSTASTPASTNASANMAARSADGIYAPGNEELMAIRMQYNDVTIEKLREGHTLYTVSACIQCHPAQNIYRYETAQWKDIIENMAQKAKISESQKDAVYMYVLAIKAQERK